MMKNDPNYASSVVFGPLAVCFFFVFTNYSIIFTNALKGRAGLRNATRKRWMTAMMKTVSVRATADGQSQVGKTR
jgi:hypothetical protein